MLPLDREYHIVWDRIATRPYLAWKKDNGFWVLFMNEIKIDRVIVSSIPVVLPTAKNTNGWIQNLWDHMIRTILTLITGSQCQLLKKWKQ